jgi:sec-independent protein translocase protein TatB
MFGMSLGEIFVIAIIAILFVGPDKLPDALVKIAKFFRSFKSTINEAKESFDRELQIKELKEEALNYKKQLQASVAEVRDTSGLDKLDDIYEEFNSINKSLELKDNKDNILEEVLEEEEEEVKEEQPKPEKEGKKKSKKQDEKLDESA